MLSDPAKTDSSVEGPLGELARLRRFTGTPADFWKAFLAAASEFAQASRSVLILRDAKQPERLKKLGDWSNNGHADRSAQAFTQVLAELTESALLNGGCKRELGTGAPGGSKAFALGIAVPLSGSQDACVAAFLLTDVSEAQAGERLLRLRMTADIPLAYQAQQAASQARRDVDKFAAVLDVMVQVNSERRFLAAAMAFCNGLANRFKCDRVSLGWLIDGYVRLKTMSRTERFDKNMVAVKSLEMVMEEALDQNGEILQPPPEKSTLVSKHHELFAREQGVQNLCSVPLRVDDKPVAVLTCERNGTPFTEVELQQFRLACDQAIPRLADLQRDDRWFGARWKSWSQEKLSKLLGPEHTWPKVFAILGCAAVVLCSVPIFTYKVEGNFILRSDEVSFLTAPFEGYIQEVNVRPGDQVAGGGALVRLNTDDLILQEAAAIADQARYFREMEKARATNALAEMRISQALADQAAARLELIRYRLEQAAIKAPFDGVIVEGDLRQRIGAPVKQGDALLKVARTDSLYVEAEVNERDVQEILRKKDAEIAFVTQPKLKFPVGITRIEQAAFPKEQENVFVVRCALTGAPEAWWRPGMSGVCKFPVEKRTLAWIFTHRTVDFLRMFFWW